MRRLSLLRHAKSSWGDAGSADRDRPLGERGRRAAPRMGAFIAANGFEPDLIVASPSARTRETLDLVLPELTTSPRVVWDEALYLAEAVTMLQVARRRGSRHGHVMLLGHNPGMHELIVQLASHGERRYLAAIAEKFPTAALAVIDFDIDDWKDLRTGGGKLVELMTPSRLE